MTAVDQLDELRGRRDQLQRTVRDGAVSLRFASADVLAASDALAAAERRRVAEGGSAADVAAAEKRLAKARQAQTADVSREIVAGQRRALGDLDRRISEFASAHYDELRDEANARAIEAAERVNETLQAVQVAHRERELVSQHNTSLLALVTRVRPGQIPYGRPEVEQLVRSSSSCVRASRR